MTETATATAPEAESAPIQTEAPTRRGPGRPPQTADQRAKEKSSAKKTEKPRRPEAPKGAASKAKAPESKVKDTVVATLAAQLVGLHQIGALATGIPEMALSNGEAMLLAGAVLKVTEEYGLALSGKTGAALQLAATAAAIYLPRLLSVKARAERSRQAAEAQRTAQDVPFVDIPAAAARA